MSRSEGDQQEIVLGNKQLLSIFFIIVVLMGVSFTIGYVIGRNTSSVNAANGSAVTRTPPSASLEPADEKPASLESRKEPVADAREKTSSIEKSNPRGSVAVSKADDPQPEKPERTTKTAAVDTNGTYLQVASLRKEDASQLVKMLQGRQFPALLGESPKEGLFRVLVGPYHDLPALAQAKQKLRGAGFDPIVAR